MPGRPNNDPVLEPARRGPGRPPRPEFRGELLFRLRREQKLSTPALSELLALRGVNVTARSILRWEDGLSRPTPAQVLVLAEVLHASPELFVARPGATGGA